MRYKFIESKKEALLNEDTERRIASLLATIILTSFAISGIAYFIHIDKMDKTEQFFGEQILALQNQVNFSIKNREKCNDLKIKNQELEQEILMLENNISVGTSLEDELFLLDESEIK